MADIPRAPEIEDIKELLAPELAEHVSRNQCTWCGFASKRSTSVHRKFCMRMQIRMWFARQRATSRNCNENGSDKPCSHRVSVYSEAHARTCHEKQCGDRFTALVMEKSRNFLTTWADTGLSEGIRLKYAAKYPGLCTLTSKLIDVCNFCYWTPHAQFAVITHTFLLLFIVLKY